MPEQHEPGIAKIPLSNCLECGARMNAAGPANRPLDPADLPTPGSYCLCMKCGAVMMYDDELRPRGMTNDEINELIADTETMNEIAKFNMRVHMYRAKMN